MEKLQLTGRNEPRGLYKPFFGRITEQMPILREAGYKPISVADIINRRLSAPTDVFGEAWLSDYSTGDAFIRGKEGDALISLNSPSLLNLTIESPLSRSDCYMSPRALVLSDEQWEEEKAKSDSLYLTADQVRNIDRKGYLNKGKLGSSIINGGIFCGFREFVWKPENKVVSDVWEFLAQGTQKDVISYAALLKHYARCSKFMKLKFIYETKDDGKALLWPLTVGPINANNYCQSPVMISDIDNYNGHDIDNYDGHLVGKLPDVQKRKRTAERGSKKGSADNITEKVLEERICGVLSQFDDFVRVRSRRDYEGVKQQALRELKGLYKEK